MKIGCCVLLKDFEEIKSIGLDFVEFGLLDIAVLSDDEIENLKKTLKENNLECFSLNRMLKASDRIVGDDVKLDEIEKFIENAFANAEKLGVKYIIFGSGKAKEVPENFSRETAYAQIIKFAKMAAKHAEKHGIIILVEPLRPAECNIIISTLEGKKLVDDVNSPYVKLLFDHYHSQNSNEDISVFDEVADMVLHTHYAVKADRSYPEKPCELEKEFIAKLKEHGYDGAISMEAGRGKVDFAAEVAQGYKIMKSYL